MTLLHEMQRREAKKGVAALDKVEDTPPVDGIAAYNAKSAELKKAGDKNPARTIATKFPELNSAYIEASQPQKGARK